MKTHILLGLASALLLPGLGMLAPQADAATTLTIATVNNPDMIVMQRLSAKFEATHPDIKLNWITLEENVLRQRVTTDIATHAGGMDIVTVGVYEVPLWAKRGWLTPFTNIPASYDVDDILKPVLSGLSYDGKPFALPFYAESQMTYYRTDLAQKAGVTVPAEPTWPQLAAIADKLNDPKNGIYGICLRGKAGWGENMGQIGPVVNGFGGRWFDLKWQPQLTSQPWEDGVKFYVDLLRKDGPPGAVSNGYNETLALFAAGHCAMWVDATVSAGFLANPKQSTVVGKVGYAAPPYTTTKIGSHYLWAWSLAVPSTSHNAAAAQEFITWATSKDYIKLVADDQGWASVPPGTRTSTYQSPDYQKAAPFAPIVLNAIDSADPHHPSILPVPYTGIQYVGIPEFQGIGTSVGQQIAAAIAGQKTVKAALAESQSETARVMRRAGYLQ
ncbi:ABC transporter substrate-binding protein [Acidisoma silvae]|uniref:Sugar ABC transporter substrate-binding protein n=1 Tax=Acidisoma silvae TaxID=2802396 RepID=A0A963YUV5_9PROT|nr:sugar ABC transporter substrate-binding protein [Acidisoma silvae]MCB8877522.1 sugar ABC transporter substrate-binding protein [Acidisoma silvae]